MYLIVGTEISAQLFSEKSDKSVSLILFAEKTERTHPFSLNNSSMIDVPVSPEAHCHSS